LEFSEVSPELIQLMQQDKWICPHLHLPLQAGDDKILQAMNRHYTTAQYRQLIGEIFAKVPDIAISTDIIVGFPGETEAQFANMLALVESLELARIHVFPYSPRRGTPAASFPDQVVERVKKSRVGQLQKLAEKKAVDFHAKFIGRELEVLLESVEDGIASGLTPNYIRVYLPTGDALRGQLKMVQLQKVFQDGLWGEIIC
jgi:threonylcarbamoyladenosine tRNA methylthiotransferase MtaB